MVLEFLRNALRQCPEYITALDGAKRGLMPLMFTGTSRLAKSILIDTLPADENRRAFVVVADEGEAAKVKDDLEALGRKCRTFFARDINLRRFEGVSREFELERIGALVSLVEENDETIIATIDATMIYTLPRQVLCQNIFTLSVGDKVDLTALTRRLVSGGYTRTLTVDGAGQFAVRGGIVDVFTPGAENPARIELWGDEIDSIVGFDVMTQRRTDIYNSITISPARELAVPDADELTKKMEKKAAAISAKNPDGAEKIYNDIDALKAGMFISNIDKYISMLYDEYASVFDYVGDAAVFIYEPSRVYERARAFSKRMSEEIKAAFEDGTLVKGLDKFALHEAQLYKILQGAHTVLLETFTATRSSVEPKNMVDIKIGDAGSFGGMAKDLVEELNYQKKRGYASVIMAGTKRAGLALVDTLNDYKIKATYHDDVPMNITPGAVIVTEGALCSGAEFAASSLAVFTKSSVSSTKKRHKNYAGQGLAIGSLDELRRGDAVVHSVYGIGVFDGINKIENDGIIKDYIKIRYLKDDILYVPVTQMDLVSRYIGGGDNEHIHLSRLGSDQWIKTKSRVKSAVRDMAKELIALYAKRESAAGFAFSEDSDLQHEFEYYFPFDETEDQLKCSDEIKADMQRPHPMDRLLCGDVGFGKTEVALRAAFKCISEGKQCAMLVPTTILAWQHYKTILERMEHFAVNVEMLSRFRTATQQTKIKKALMRGEIDIIVGTHRIISNDVKFRDLGLLIIDEEQRFGVAQKEKLKQLYPDVDVLTLSATPIPRTLNMAMSGLRDMSIIEEAPQDRHPVQTYVLEYDKGIIMDAIRRELSRAGQVYYIYNRVETISRVAMRIKEELPEATVAVAHGQMSEEELGDVWRRMIDHEIDVLVCTTIIETGVDVANVNTLIIEDADRFGLSQLHQIRGRVGRSKRRAYAYMTFRRGKALSEIAQKRLEALREYTEFGSGFKIAMRDLEIRGAGNILGAKQHGQMESVGYDMYLKLLEDAVREQKGEAPEKSAECTVDLQIEAHIPEDYIEDLPARLQIYRRIAQIRTKDDALDVTDELIDRFGEPPKSVTGLIDIALLRQRAAALGINDIGDKTGEIKLSFEYFDIDNIMRMITDSGGKMRLHGGEKPYITMKRDNGEMSENILKKFIDDYDAVVNGEAKNQLCH